MFIKVTRRGPNRYVQLVEAYRDPDGKPKQRTLATLGVARLTPIVLPTKLSSQDFGKIKPVFPHWRHKNFWSHPSFDRTPDQTAVIAFSAKNGNPKIPIHYDRCGKVRLELLLIVKQIPWFALMLLRAILLQRGCDVIAIGL